MCLTHNFSFLHFSVNSVCVPQKFSLSLPLRNTKTTMKRLLPILLLILGCAYCSAEVKYSGSHRGYHYILTISIVKENGKAFLDVLSMDRRRTQIEEPKMLI